MAGRLKRAMAQLFTGGDAELIVVPPKPILGERSPQWRAFRNRFIADFPTCAVCGTKEDCDVHHCAPFHIAPQLELAASNLITLCTAHHFTFGHCCLWRSWNVNVRQDAAEWRRRIIGRP